MNDAVLTALQYYGAIAATVAALIVSLDLGPNGRAMRW